MTESVERPSEPSSSVPRKSVALSQFLALAGEAVFTLNTIAVGLASIRQDTEKPDGLDISWKPKDPILAAKKARKAAIHASMVEVAEALDQYVQTVLKLPRCKAISAKINSNTSKAERLEWLGAEVLDGHGESGVPPVPNSVVLCGALLLIHWRNRHVHRNSNAGLRGDQKAKWIKLERVIADAFAGLSVTRTIAHFEERRPTLKDGTSLIAMTIRLVRSLDRTLSECSSAEDVIAWLRAYDLESGIEKVRRETAQDRQPSAISKFLAAQAPELVDPYFRLCVDAFPTEMPDASVT